MEKTHASPSLSAIQGAGEEKKTEKDSDTVEEKMEQCTLEKPAAADPKRKKP